MQTPSPVHLYREVVQAVHHHSCRIISGMRQRVRHHGLGVILIEQFIIWRQEWATS
jgi:hypothetical protein